MITYINLSVTIKDIKREDLEKVFSIMDSQKAKFKRAFSVKGIEKYVKKKAEEAMLSAKIRVQGLSKEIVDAFTVKETETNQKGELVRRFTLHHKWFLNKYADIERKSGVGNVHIISRRNLYKVLDTGREAYEIPKRNGGGYAKLFSPLKFYWHNQSKWITFHWKGKKGGRKRWIRIKPNSGNKVFERGARFSDAAWSAMDEYIEEQFSKIV